MQKTVLLYFALLFWLVVPVQAQLAFTLPELSADAGEEIVIDFKVEDYNQIIATQFTFAWDSSVLEFVEILDIRFPEFNPAIHLNTTTVENGFFVCAWADLSLTGFSLEDGDHFMQVKFKVIGNPGDTSELSFTDDPMPVLAGDANTSGPIPLIINNGYLTVNGSNSTSNPEDFGWNVSSISPNPFDERTTIDFYLPNSSEVEWSIFDAVGKKIFYKSTSYSPGKQSITLEQQFFPVSGTYFVQMQTADFVHTQKVDFIK